MITRVDGRALSERERQALRKSDPMLGQPLVIDPMPGVAANDLLKAINEELGVPAYLAGQLRRTGRHLYALEAWKVPGVIVLDADFLASGCLSALEALTDPSTPTITATFDRHVDADLESPSSLQMLAIAIGSDDDRQQAQMSEHARMRAGAVSRQVRTLFYGGDRWMPELGLVAAAAMIFHRPRSVSATRLRLAGFDDALRAHGYRVAESPELVSAAAQGSWPRGWLLDALEPRPTKRAQLTPPNCLPYALPADRQTAEAFVADRTHNTGKTYARALVSLLAWRDEQQIAANEHREEPLLQWAHELVRYGTALTTAYAYVSAARSYYVFLQTGVTQHLDGPARWSPRREPLALTFPRLPDPYALPQDAPPHDDAKSRGRRLHTESAKRLMKRKGWDADAFWLAVDSTVPQIEPVAIARVSASTSARALQRDVQRFHGTLFVLVHDIALAALPPEVLAGSPQVVKTWIAHARSSGVWNELVAPLRNEPRFAGVDWDRPF